MIAGCLLPVLWRATTSANHLSPLTVTSFLSLNSFNVRPPITPDLESEIKVAELMMYEKIKVKSL
jgi:hypothetical protein